MTFFFYVAFTYSLSPSASKTATAAIGVTIGVSRICANQSSWKHLLKASFRIKIFKVPAHKNVWALAETFSQDEIKILISQSQNNEIVYSM